MAKQTLRQIIATGIAAAGIGLAAFCAGCEDPNGNVGLAALGNMAQVSPYASANERTLGAGLGTIGQMGHQMNTAQAGRSEVNVNTGTSQNISQTPSEAAGTRGGPARGGLAGTSDEERAKMRERFQNMSEEERAKFREEMRGRFENMSEEERAQMRSRFVTSTRLSRDEQLKAIKAIEEQLAKLKASIESSARPADANFSALSEEERTKLRDQFTKSREARQAAVDAIRAEIDKLSPPRPTPAQMEALR